MLGLTEWLMLAGVCAMGAMAPGVSLAVITRHTLLGGPRAGVVAALTHAFGVGLWATATVMGMALLFKQHPKLDLIVSLVGSVCLIGMAVNAWRASYRDLPDESDGQSFGVLHGAARDGFMVAFLNPKVGLFFLALFSQFLRADMNWVGRTQMVATSVVLDGVWYTLVATMLGRSRLLGWLREHHKWVERGTAALLTLVALSVLARSLFGDAGPAG
jgi:threonine/homoserine/homoserine lactone efflux protein